MKAELMFYNKDRSYLLERITENTGMKERTTTWSFLYSNQHETCDMPRTYVHQINVKLDNIKSYQIYEHVFKSLATMKK